MRPPPYAAQPWHHGSGSRQHEAPSTSNPSARSQPPSKPPSFDESEPEPAPYENPQRRQAHWPVVLDGPKPDRQEAFPHPGTGARWGFVALSRDETAPLRQAGLFRNIGSFESGSATIGESQPLLPPFHESDGPCGGCRQNRRAISAAMSRGADHARLIENRTATSSRKRPNASSSVRFGRAWAICAPIGAAASVAGMISAKAIQLT